MNDTRNDANRIAMKVASTILDAAHGFQFNVDGVAFHVVVQRLPTPPWPIVEGLSLEADGPWPAPAKLYCSWAAGKAVLTLEAFRWGGTGRYRHLIGLRISVARRNVLWITLALPIRAAEKGTDAEIEASITPFGGGSFESGEWTPSRVLSRAGLPLTSESRVQACLVRLPEGSVLPSPDEAFERLVKIGILKLPFFLDDDDDGIEGEPPFLVTRAKNETEPSYVATADTLGEKRAGIWPLPGGVRQYKGTLDALLESIGVEPMPLESFRGLLRDRYDVTGEVSTKGYISVLEGLGFARVEDGAIARTAEATEYLRDREPIALFDRLRTSYIGVLELLVLVSVLGQADSRRVFELLRSLLGTTWETPNQVSFRRNWLLSLGLTDRSSEGDALTDFGRSVLESHGLEVATIRKRIDALIDEVRAEEEPDEDVAVVEGTTHVAPGLDAAPRVGRAEPSAWSADRVDLRAEMLAKEIANFEFPSSTIASAVAALSAGKHLLLVGPPGTGKTELAHAIVSAARAEGYCAGAFVTTASADWTTFDTIGGYALQRDGQLRFRSGSLLRAIEKWQWLVIDELNRADVDRAFGELMTVLAGRTTDTSFELEGGRTVRIGPDPDASHPMPRTFRVLATMNTWDKTSLFRLSYAMQRRFAIVQVDVPDDPAFAALVSRHAEQAGFDPQLDERAAKSLVSLFSSRGLSSVRAIGPAIALDVIRYVRRRVGVAGQEPVSAADAIAEALDMYVLPQLEGLDPDKAIDVRKVAFDELGGSLSLLARSQLERKFAELFPHVRFSP